MGEEREREMEIKEGVSGSSEKEVMGVEKGAQKELEV